MKFWFHTLNANKRSACRPHGEAFVSAEGKAQADNRKMIIIASVIIAVIAIIGLAFVLIHKPVHTGTSKAEMVNVEVKEASPKTSTTATTTKPQAKPKGTINKIFEKELYTMKFRKLVNVKLAAPLNYPTKDGVVFIAVRTVGGTEQIWTFKDGKLVGVYDLPRLSAPVIDPRLMSYAVKDDKLLMVINNTLYELYGNQTKKIAHINTTGRASFIKIGNDIYAWEIKTWKKGNVTYGYCAFYDALHGMKKLKEFKFEAKNATVMNILPDAIDAEGCFAVWAKRFDMNVYWAYKGDNGQANGTFNPMKMRLTTYGPMFLEKAPYKTNPYILMIENVIPGTVHAFKLYFYDVLQNKNTSFVLPGLYNFVGIGDFQGVGYLADAAFVTASPEGFTILYLNPHGWKKEIRIGKLTPSYAWLQGVIYKTDGSFMNIFGLGNFTKNLLDVVTNVGTFHFKVVGVKNITKSSITIIASINGDELCYSAVVNPTTGGLVSRENLNTGTVYISSGCYKGSPLT
ncbi:hypothetical protein IPA_03445 [Ignicoccus pacificus DSM 13166]|uniref:Uncharacterized protein n=1 Tax=Ignicoccus pacificus DSM 13166 TaxID=940294 RepID=A0A977KAZ1_9CREN|nr:hypothetical protein IPA_03445 [Ignicoccus pacificus DSM 13166]